MTCVTFLLGNVVHCFQMGILLLLYSMLALKRSILHYFAFTEFDVVCVECVVQSQSFFNLCSNRVETWPETERGKNQADFRAPG